MIDNPTPNDIDLETFLKMAGQSFTDAQSTLVSGLGVSAKMMLSNAELELKVAASSDALGKISIRPISSEDIVRGGIDPGLLSTIRINFVNSIGEVERQPVTASDSTGKGNTVPLLVGRTIDEAVAFLKSGGWQYELHAAGIDEVAVADKERRGKVIRQQPPSSQVVDKTSVTTHLWIDLGNTSVIELDGIGVKLGGKLSGIGITSVGELSLASVTQVASGLNVSETQAKRFIDMAYLISRLTVLDFKDEVVELLVKGADIHSIEQLADADPAKLYSDCKEAVSSGKVRVPRGFSFTAGDVKAWIKAADSYLGR